VALQLKVEEDPEEFPSQWITKQASVEETDEFLEQCLAAEHRREEAEHTHRLGLFINLEDDGDAGMSSMSRRRGDVGQGNNNSYYVSPKKEPDGEEEDNYATDM
jgi:hypothetical protein